MQCYQGFIAEELPDTILEVDDTIRAGFALETEEDMLCHLFSNEVQSVLIRHPDQRLELIFNMVMNDNPTLCEIGDCLNLSIGRVDTLLQQALDLLHNDPDVQILTTWEVVSLCHTDRGMPGMPGMPGDVYKLVGCS
jgi:DNA-directed RNA polymerase sigma subunit (sigma70/sigma32)